jgi:hypothetical protein
MTASIVGCISEPHAYALNPSFRSSQRSPSPPRAWAASAPVERTFQKPSLPSTIASVEVKPSAASAAASRPSIAALPGWNALPMLP